MIEGAPFPVIKGIYDPLSKKSDGTITTQAPIIITGCNLEMLTWENIKLCIIPVINDKILIELNDVHKCSKDKVCATIPQIDAGEYLLALKMKMKSKECFLYTFPISLVVRLGQSGRPDLYPYNRDNDK